MKRNVSMEEISDGRLYDLNDMVKADCGDCAGCFTCCTGMGQSIIVDPLDVHMLKTNLGMTFEELLKENLELNVVDGIILPNLRMGEGDACTFIKNGRCSIHPFRPGVCRLFPLGRVYEDGDFKYFLQVNECVKPNRTKIKVKKWIDTPDIERNQQYIREWHYFLKDAQDYIVQKGDEVVAKQLNMLVLQLFFVKNYDVNEDFYTQVHDRIETAKTVMDE